MFQLVTISDMELKHDICNKILRALPKWFEIEHSITEYSKATEEMPFYVVYDEGKPIGFVAIKVHNKYTAEVYVMGVLEEYHRKGVGKILINSCREYCLVNGMEFLTVKTLDESISYIYYENTRRFYLSVGFKPLEVFRTLWDENNPCLFMAMHIDITKSIP